MDESRRRVLVAEDTAAIALLIERTLAKAGYDVTLAADGARACALFREREFDAVVMDLQMPVLDGCGAAQAIRADERARGRARAPIVALTAGADPVEAEKALAAGCDACLAKPIEREQFIATLARLLGDGPIVPHPDADIADMVPGYLEQRRSEIPHLREALARGDFPHLSATGHRIVGGGASYGFDGLSDLGRALELAGKAADADAAARALDRLADYLARVRLE